MATITLRVDEQTRADTEALARARGITVSELVRVAVDDQLGRGDGSGDAPQRTAPASLSSVDRQSLVLLHQVLAKLNGADLDQDADYHMRRVKVLAGGFTVDYADEFVGIEPELSRRECELVWDIFDMFRILKVSVAKVGEEKAREIDEHGLHALTFRGFDGNDSFESRLCTYAQHLVSNGRWEEFAEYFDRGHDYGNSHSPTLATYRRLLGAYQPIFKVKIKSARGLAANYLLTEQELIEVLRAWPYPESTR